MRLAVNLHLLSKHFGKGLKYNYLTMSSPFKPPPIWLSSDDVCSEEDFLEWLKSYRHTDSVGPKEDRKEDLIKGFNCSVLHLLGRLSNYIGQPERLG